MEVIQCKHLNIDIPFIPKNKYGIYPDGTVINLYTKTMVSPFKREEELYVNLFGDYKRTARPVSILLAKTYLHQTDEDRKFKRNKADVIDLDRRPKLNNVRWVSSFEKSLIKQMKKNRPTCNMDYVDYFCKLFHHGYTVDEACRFLNFNNILYASNIRNRRIYSDMSSKYTWK